MLINNSFSRCLYLVVLVVLGAADSTAAPTHPITSSSFRFSLQDQNSSVVGKCVATLIVKDWLITAAHCFEDSPTEIFAHCSGPEFETGSQLLVSKTTLHPEFDLALVKIENLPDCITEPLAYLKAINDGVVFSSANIGASVSNNEYYEFELVQQNELTLVLLDSNACLSRGDSGYPLLVNIGDRYLMAGVLINGTEGCPSYQTFVRLDKQADWIDAVTGSNASVRDTNTLSCDVEVCLEVPTPGALFCSIDPPGVNSLSAFARKSELMFSEGIFNLESTSASSMPAMTLKRADISIQYKSDGPLRVLKLPTLSDNGGGQPRLEVVAMYASAVDSIEVGFRVTTGTTPSIYRMGDDDALSYMSSGLNMRVTSSSGTTLYSPCNFSDQTNRQFQFELSDGTRVSATAQATVGAYELGFYLGHLLGADIEHAGFVTEVTDRFRLGYLGSSITQGDLNAPSIVIRTEQIDNDCGYVFDPSEWDSAQAVDGYVAYSLECDGALGKRLPLESAIYPDDYVFP